MKIAQNWYLAVMFVFTLLVAACSPPSAPQAPESPVAPSGLSITLTKPLATSKAILGATQGADLANSYEALVISSDTFQSAKLVPGIPTILSLAAGSYRVIVLAGYRRSDTVTTALLLGSAYSETEASVVDGQRTQVNLTLRAIDFSFALDSEPSAGNQTTLLAMGKSRNPYVGMLLAGASTTARPRLRSTALWNGYHEFQTIVGSEADWTATLPIIPEAALTSMDLQFLGSGLSLVDCGGQTGALSGKTKWTWKWPNRSDMLDDGPLVNLVDLIKPLIPPTTGLEIALHWE